MGNLQKGFPPGTPMDIQEKVLKNKHLFKNVYGTLKSLPLLALDRAMFPRCTKKSAQKPAKPLNSLEDLAHKIDKRFVLTYTSQVVNNGSLDSVPTWEESLINLDYLLAWA
ncbi:hypothetical protein DSO57_1035147 [Entomophthora muscae]|uniref:Uncharacterized protein n=1 Tax=Entomophthora muscae TaxID=34485 RepID=A0ACC2SCK4_9FUNG|nr:hypothetical protein DSO57_1035147 [Entomophthora muscae]